jgi:hypothetical protein
VCTGNEIAELLNQQGYRPGGSARRKLSAPFGRRIAEPLDADAAGQATFYRCDAGADRLWEAGLAVLALQLFRIESERKPKPHQE